jgi:phenylacetate-CoA ligase
MYDTIFQHLVFPRLDRRRGYGLLGRIRRFEELLSLPAERVVALQAGRLRAIAVHAASTSPFWAERFRESGIDPAAIRSGDDLRGLPILEKGEVRRSREAMVSSAVPPERRIEAMTGGSTASPLRFYRDLECLAEREALNWVFHRRLGRQPCDRWALVWGAMRDLGPVQGFRARLRARLLERCVILPGNQMDPDSMDRFVARMRGFRPRFLHGYSQAVALLARHIEEQRLRPPRLEGITVTAEPITPEQRRTVAAAFGCPVHSIYGTREFGFLAAECTEHRGMHLNPLSCYVEFLRADGSPAAPGEPGQVIVTDLLNRALPLIRYRIGDVGVPSPHGCPCGSSIPAMEIAAGRETDFLVLPGGRCIAGASITLVSSAGIAKLQYIQRTPQELTVRYVAAPSFHPGSLDELRQKLLGVFGDALQYRFEQVDDLPTSPSGKFAYVYSEVARRRFSNQPMVL